MDKIQKTRRLVKELNEYRHYYYNLNNPKISDAEYDKMVDQLEKLEVETGFILSNSPTQTVGYEVVSKLKKRTHPTPLKSLAKTKSLDELNKWKKDKNVLLMLKADGLTVELVYENGVFVGGYTRGNSEIGEDISHNIVTFQNVPLTIPFKGKLRIAGEAIIHWNDFDEINSVLSQEDKYATPRNLCSGSVRQLNSEICSKRKVYFYAFNILECNEELSDYKDKNFDWLNDLGFTVILYVMASDDIYQNEIEIIKEAADITNMPYDGMVITFDSISYSKSLGETSHHPHHSRAYKETDETVETVLTGVEWNTTRTGHINPVALFQTTILDNTEVSRASLHNLSIIKNLSLSVGNKIIVSKRNQIIPHIEENLDIDNGNTMDFPEHCPSCGERTIVKNTGTAEFLFCDNKQCPAQILDRFVNLVKREGMDIQGLSEATLEKFINKGFLKTFDDIYSLEKYKNEIIKMEGFGLKSYNRLMESISQSRKVKLNKFIVALGISEIGRSASKVIAKQFNDDWFEFEEALNNGFDFTQLKDFGQIMNDNLRNWYKDDNERKMWIKLTYILEFEKEEKKVEKGLKSLEGLTFVVTGSVETFKNRKELEALISNLDGKLSGSVSSKTSYLINNDVESVSGKNRKAKDLNVPIISESQFNDMIGRK